MNPEAAAAHRAASQLRSLAEVLNSLSPVIEALAARCAQLELAARTLARDFDSIADPASSDISSTGSPPPF